MNLATCASNNPCLKSFNLALLEEVKTCIKGFNHSKGQGWEGSSAGLSVINLVSVGGLQVQDLPMSGNLQASCFLLDSSHLQALLSCFIPLLGRVYLVDQSQSKQIDSVMYQNPSHRLFYQTCYLDIDNIVNHSLDSYQPETYTDYFNNVLPDSPVYLAVELANPDHEATGFDQAEIRKGKDLFDGHKLNKLVLAGIEKNKSLNLVSAQLDILSAKQIEQGLSIILRHCNDFLNEFDGHSLKQAGQYFLNEWKDLSIEYGRDYKGEFAYQSALNRFRETFMSRVNALVSKMPFASQQMTKQALDTIAFQLNFFPPAPQRIDRKALIKSQQRRSMDSNHIGELPRFDRPVFIVSAPRSGSTLLFETLMQLNGVWSTGEENHAQLEAIKGLHPRDNDWHSNSLNAGNVSEAIKYDVLKMFVAQLQNKHHQHFLTLPVNERPVSTRFIEKTPKNALRIAFLKTLFPDALFIYLHRDAKSNISSLIDGWRSQRFISYRNLPGLAYRHWSFLLIPGWREFLDSSIAEIATQQWKVSNWRIQDDLAKLPDSDWMEMTYQSLIDQPKESIAAICQFAGFDWDAAIEARCQDSLPVSRLTLSSPQKDKWMKHSSLMGSNFYTRSKYRVYK